MQIHAKSKQAKVKLNVQKELLVKQLEREVHLKSRWSLQSELWQPRIKKHNFQHKSSTQRMLWQLHPACNSYLLFLLMFYKETRQVIHLGKGTHYIPTCS